MRVRRRRKARGSVPGGLGACAASQRRASRDKKSQLYETQSHKKYSTFTTKISVIVFRRSPSPAAALMHIRFSHFASRKAQSREHTLHRAGARSVVHRATTQCRPPSPSLPPQLHVGLHRVRRWRTVRARPPDPRPSRGRQRPRFLQRFRVDYPSGSPRAGRARATTRRAIGVARRTSARPVSPAARSRRRAHASLRAAPRRSTDREPARARALFLPTGARRGGARHLRCKQTPVS